ncbi:nuclease homologue [Jannaschia faecimaris]|uniref:Nuclease homologue n=1 Tax=Jannaschia faecimaris TaxID=1244108 RepID=A0A1H3IY62_9RHOB|nr:thermonuclease family protein [Jannaschia faecimaris]SDY31844.1 nuclease homologue [Jannaschia faecimaris]
MNHPHGNNAKWALIHMCKGQKIRAEVPQKDVHDRTVARCYLPDGRDLSAEMVKAGFAID